jgi:hypothetical protein
MGNGGKPTSAIGLFSVRCSSAPPNDSLHYFFLSSVSFAGCAPWVPWDPVPNPLTPTDDPVARQLRVIGGFSGMCHRQCRGLVRRWPLTLADEGRAELWQAIRLDGIIRNSHKLWKSILRKTPLNSHANDTTNCALKKIMTAFISK